MENSFYSFKSTTPVAQPAPQTNWLTVLNTALQAGATIFAATQQANAATGMNINPNQVPSYIIQGLPPQYAHMFNQQNGAPPTLHKDSKILGMDQTTGILVILAIVAAIGIGAFYLLKK